MKNEFVRRAISISEDEEHKRIIKKIEEVFGQKLNGIQATKVAAWKLRASKLNIDAKQLLQILGGKI